MKNFVVPFGTFHPHQSFSKNPLLQFDLLKKLKKKLSGGSRWIKKKIGKVVRKITGNDITTLISDNEIHFVRTRYLGKSMARRSAW